MTVAEHRIAPDLFPVAEARRESRMPAYLAYVAICILWGTTFVGIRVAIETIPTLLVTALRFLSAGAILFVIARISGARFPRARREWLDQALSGVVMVGLGNTLVVYAEHELTSGLAALLAATIPIWMAIMESLRGGAPFTTRKIIGLVLGFGGVGLLVAPAIGNFSMSLPFVLAVGAMQLSAIAWNSGTLYSRRHPSHADPMATAVIQMVAGGLAVALLAVVRGELPRVEMFSLRSTAALIYLAIFGSVLGYTFYLYALTKLSAGKVSSYAYVNPVVAVLVGSLLLGEAVTLRMIAAMIVILAGVAVIQLDRRFFAR
jgi:drug/metabolite transporter (DMT)-like permease